MSSPRLEFDFEWRITLFTLLLLPLLISLGFWQLQRAEEKQALAVAFAARQQRPPLPLSQLRDRPAAQLAYQRVSLSGHYREEETFLLENQVRDGRYGNEVLTVFELDAGALVLVNRGWVPADPTRREATPVPSPPPADRGVTLDGRIYVPPGAPFLLADQPLEPGWPKRLQAVQMDKLAAALGAPLFAYTVRIAAGQPGALRADWQVVNISPARHRAYAVQWFAMAAVLFLLYLVRSTNVWKLIRGTAGADTSNE